MNDAGGSAFPIVGDDGLRLSNSEGMSLRDYFAAKAMQAICINTKFVHDIAEQAYRQADAMLEARKS